MTPSGRLAAGTAAICGARPPGLCHTRHTAASRVHTVHTDGQTDRRAGVHAPTPTAGGYTRAESRFAQCIANGSDVISVHDTRRAVRTRILVIALKRTVTSAFSDICSSCHHGFGLTERLRGRSQRSIIFPQTYPTLPFVVRTQGSTAQHCSQQRRTAPNAFLPAVPIAT